MGKKSKVGKARKDKFYHLAKETGYRARSAFKLLQLNRKFEFLQKSRICIDLCAAPGGWMQVAANLMPVSSIIIGVDLIPIKPVPGCLSFTEDITTAKCKQTLKKELKDWKADVVMNDGAGNIGMNWIHDAYQQVELTLAALKLATDILRKGGWFVTKVFRSKDYHALMWVFNQLFKKVHATKPQASRNESAEIFVVCESYHRPDKLDPKFLDPKYVFKDVDMDPKKSGLNLIHPEKERKKADGYADGDLTCFAQLPASNFIEADNYLELLTAASEIVIDHQWIKNHEKTSSEIDLCCKDIKVLGKKEIRSIINWRKALKKHLDENKDLNTSEASDSMTRSNGLSDKVREDENDDEMELDEDEDSSGSNDDMDVNDESEGDSGDTDEGGEESEEKQLAEQLAKLKEEEQKQLRKKRKKVLKEKRKLRDKMSLNMVIPGDKIEVTDDVTLFDIKKIKSKNQLTQVEKTKMEDLLEEEEEEIEDEPITKEKKLMMIYDRFKNEPNDGPESSSDDEAVSESGESEIDEADEEDTTPSNANPLVVDLESQDSKTQRRMEMWFNKDVFSGLEGDEVEDIEIGHMSKHYQEKGGVILGQNEQNETQANHKSSKTKAAKKTLMTESEDSSESSSDSDDESDYDVNEMLKSGKSVDDKQPDKAVKKDGFEIVSTGQKITKLDPHGLALGEEMVKSRKRQREIEEMSFHKYTFNDDHLPDWFVKDESKHIKRLTPVTKDQVDYYKERMKAINARPIGKVAEAKARKHKKMMKKLERARKKAESIGETVDTSDKEKMSRIKDVYKRAGLLKQKKPNVEYVVAKRGTGKRVRRPAGVKGRFKVVDPRMKKDNMKKKQDAKKGKSGKKKTPRR